MNIDFCILDDPFGGNEKVVFITRAGLSYIDCTIRKEDSFGELIDFLKENNYFETEYLKFEYMKEKNEKPTSDKLKKGLEKIGAKYNKIFENRIKEDYENLKNLPFHSLLNIVLPAVNKSLNLNIFLFFEFLFPDEDRFVVDLAGEFRHGGMSKDGRIKDLVKAINLEFERLGDKGKYYQFQTVKNKGEIIKELSFFYEIYVDIFKYKVVSKTETLVKKDGLFYHIMDIKDKINSEEKIFFTVDKKDLSRMFLLSEKIGIEYQEQKEKTIEIEEVYESYINLCMSLETQMLEFADDEEFKKAAKIKGDLTLIKEKSEKFFKENKHIDKISKEEFHSYFNFKE